MDWYSKSKRGSFSNTTSPGITGSGVVGGVAYSPQGYTQAPNQHTPVTGTTTPTYTSPLQRSQFYSNYHPLLPPSSAGEGKTGGSAGGPTSGLSPTNNNNNNYNNSSSANANANQMVFEDGISDRHSYYFSQLPLYCADWTQLHGAGDVDCIALSSYKEGFSNKIQVIHGVAYSHSQAGDEDEFVSPAAAAAAASAAAASATSTPNPDAIDGFDLHKVAEIVVDYPVTHLQWDPAMLTMQNGYYERLAASSEVLRLYKVDHENYDANNNFKLTQTHVLANNSTASSSAATGARGGMSGIGEDINTFPPVTSFDWNKVDPSIIITSSVDTTCTVWDLNRSTRVNGGSSGSGKVDSAQVKTQLIAHDSEVFDVKFIHDSTNIFASVGNDGSMRVFDLRSLEHSTIIYEPPASGGTNGSGSASPPSQAGGNRSYNRNALIQLSASNVDAHYLATVGVNSNQVIVIDMRMPGIPVVTLDGSLGGMNHAAINCIRWHPLSNYLLTGGDDCQALVWDCSGLAKLSSSTPGSASSTATPTPNPSAATATSGDGTKLKNGETSMGMGMTLDCPVLAYEEDLEVNQVCWRRKHGDWMGVVSGKGFQAVQL